MAIESKPTCRNHIEVNGYQMLLAFQRKIQRFTIDITLFNAFILSFKLSKYFEAKYKKDFSIQHHVGQIWAFSQFYLAMIYPSRITKYTRMRCIDKKAFKNKKIAHYFQTLVILKSLQQTVLNSLPSYFF